MRLEAVIRRESGTDRHVIYDRRSGWRIGTVENILPTATDFAALFVTAPEMSEVMDAIETEYGKPGAKFTPGIAAILRKIGMIKERRAELCRLAKR